jgi:hypothetical protein
MWLRSWAMHCPMSRLFARPAAHALPGLFMIAATAGAFACTSTEDVRPAATTDA